jgi:hypothetical protein
LSPWIRKNRKCCKKSGFNYKLVCFKKVSNPKKIEKEFLNEYKRVNFEKTFDGHTEFRNVEPTKILNKLRKKFGNNLIDN